MVTKVFISQPMRGKTDQEIIGERANVRCFLTKMLKEPIEIIDSVIDEKPDDSIKTERIPVWYLSKSIELLVKADIAFFCREWREARGCVIEHEVAERYGMDGLISESGQIAKERNVKAPIPLVIKRLAIRLPYRSGSTF